MHIKKCGFSSIYYAISGIQPRGGKESVELLLLYEYISKILKFLDRCCYSVIFFPNCLHTSNHIMFQL